MFASSTTSGLIDEFNSRFTTADGAHFLIAASGENAWPISEQDGVELRHRYRRRMMRARLIRRLSLLLFPVLLVVGWSLQGMPRGIVDAYNTMTAVSLFVAPLFGFLQHAATSKITKARIDKELGRRFAVYHEAAIKPTGSPLARTVRKLMYLSGITLALIEIGLILAPQHDHAAHMRVLTGLTVGNEGQLAHFTGTLVYLLVWTMLVGSVLLWLDRRKNRRKVSNPSTQTRRTVSIKTSSQDSAGG